MEISKRKIMIVDDSALNRALLSDILADDYEIVEAENGLQAMAYLHEHGLDISLMLLDIVMPEMDGFEVLAMMHKNGWINTIPVIMISAENSGAYIDRAYDLGAIDYINRPFDERTVKHRVACNFMMSIKQKEMQALLSDQIYQKEKDKNLMIEILSNIVEFRNGESGMHVLHVNMITEQILKALVKKSDKYPLKAKDISLIATASALHDIGKIAIPSEILNKPGPLTAEEFEVMKHHTVDGAQMLDSIPFRKDEELVRVSYQICRWHHERYDGAGYPDGLVGDDIPIAAQVVALADVYDALTSKRVYKDAIPAEVAVKMIANGECGAFNPLLVECLQEIAPELKFQLNVISNGNNAEDSINESVQQLFKSSGTDVSRRLVKQIEHERMKYKFLSDISHEITFEYVVFPEMIRLSDWSAESLGLPENIVDPIENEPWCKVFPRRSFKDFVDAINKSSPQNDIIVKQYLIDMGGGEKWCKVIAKAMWTDDENSSVLEGAICKIMDVHDTTVTLEQLERRAEHDGRTGLLNADAAEKHIGDALKIPGNYALLFMDIDDFKRANDDHGHLFGDAVLEDFAARIKKNIRSADIAARIGGDEFIIFLNCGEHVESLIQRIYNGLLGECGGFNITVSMGVATTGGKIVDYDTLISHADAAMYSIKKDGKNGFAFYDDSMKELIGVSQGKRRDNDVT